MTVLLSDLAGLVDAVRATGRQVIGPTVQDGAIVLAELESAADLPYGVGVALEPGGYRLRERDDRAAFGHSAGPQSWKRYLHPPRRLLFEATRDGYTEPPPADTPLAFLGVRPCDLRAVGILDRVLGGTGRPDVLVIAVNCTEPGELCFCVSAGGGPKAGPGYDIVLTELPEGFLADAGTQAGAGLLDGLPAAPVLPGLVEAAEQALVAAADRMGRALPPGDLRTLLAASRESPHWQDVASRCLTCGNCTMACPTCFCTTVEDTTDLTGEVAQRWETWDSCFDIDFSYLHGGSVRTSGASRYRQWLTHKLGTWHDQFGESGCVGCGRCIVWCPVGIDITAEVAALGAHPEGERPKAAPEGERLKAAPEGERLKAAPEGERLKDSAQHLEE